MHGENLKLATRSFFVLSTVVMKVLTIWRLTATIWVVPHS